MIDTGSKILCMQAWRKKRPGCITLCKSSSKSRSKEPNYKKRFILHVCVLYPCLTFPLLAREVIIRIHSCYQITIFDSKKRRCLSHFSSFLLQVRLPFWRGEIFCLPRWHWSPKLGMKIGFTWFRNKAIKIFFSSLQPHVLEVSLLLSNFFSPNWCSFKTDVFQRTKKKVWKEEEPERKSRCSATCLCALLPRKGRKRPLLKKRKKYIALLSAKLWLSEEPAWCSSS